MIFHTMKVVFVVRMNVSLFEHIKKYYLFEFVKCVIYIIVLKPVCYILLNSTLLEAHIQTKSSNMSIFTKTRDFVLLVTRYFNKLL